MLFAFAIAPKPHQQDDLKTSIVQLVNEFEANPYESPAITTLSARYHIKRRRLYDVINVFTSIGCCEKSCLDHIVWLGKVKILAKLKDLRTLRNIDDQTKTLDELFPINSCIGISNLTTCFILLFYALRSNKLDIRFAGQFLSRGTGRYKTTLCKLYQISYILSALGITTRSDQVCEVIMNPPYIEGDDIYNAPSFGDKEDSVMSLDVLLNRPVKSSNGHYSIRRREELKECFIRNIQKENGVKNDAQDVGDVVDSD